MNLELNTINILNIFLFAGVIQGFAISLKLISKKSLSKDNFSLSIWILLLALSNFQIIINSSNLYQLFGQSFTLFLPLTFNLFFGPLIWIFIKMNTDKNYIFKGKQYFHLLPGAIELIYFWTIYVQPLQFRQSFYMTHWSYIEPTLEVLALLSFISYLLYSIKSLDKFRKTIELEYSDSSIEKYQWLKSLLSILLIFTGIWGILTIADVFFMGYSLDYLYFYPYYFFIAFIAYFIGFSFNPGEKKKVLIDFAKANPKELVSETDQKEIILRLNELMNSKTLYLKSDLRSRDVALKLNITVQTLSYVLNNGLNKSFNDYVNEYRIHHVKESLKAGDLEKKTLAGIGIEAGFNSESSFYRIFKKHTGLTPKNYLK